MTALNLCALSTKTTARAAFSQVTGTIYKQGQPVTVTGFPIHQGVTTSTVAFVDLLTAEGAIVWDVQVAPAELDGVQVDPIRYGASDSLLWHVAEKNFGGRGARCLAELAMREAVRAQAAADEIAERVARSRRDAARLMAVGR